MIAVIDYGTGNLRSVSKGLETVGGKVIVTSNPDEVLAADKVVLPGVGAFEVAMKNLRVNSMDEVVKACIDEGKPFLGICLGLQLLFETSLEDGCHDGLGILGGKVVRFENDPQKREMKIPQMGWNQVEFAREAPHFKGIPDNSYFYFVHSYYVTASNPDVVAGETEYLRRFTSAAVKDNVFASQFHPEKSQKWGLKLLENFVKL